MSATLHSRIADPRTLSPELREEMFALMARCYDCVSRDRFVSDLSAKDHVILLHDETGSLRGFSTQQCFDWTLRERPIRVLFSGDTIIDPACWGTVELVRGWCQVAADEMARRPDVPLFWFLISKGYRTWLYLPVFFRRFLPSPKNDAPPDWKPLLDQLADHKFGAAYDQASGLIRFPDSMGQLSKELAAVPPARSDDPNVRFFLARNPDYARGVELACLTLVSPDNTRGPGRRMLVQALQQCAVSPA